MILALITAGVVFSAVYFGEFWPSDQQASLPTPDLTSPESTASPSAKPTAKPSPAKTPGLTSVPVPMPTGGSGIFFDRPVPWELLLNNASCKLQGEIKFLAYDLYSHQDALFTYNGIDNPARNIFWTITPEDDLSVGPNLFSKISLPNGESLLSIVLPENPKSLKYELTAKIQYGRLIDDKGNFVTVGGNVKVFEKQCEGKTTVILPSR